MMMMMMMMMMMILMDIQGDSKRKVIIETLSPHTLLPVHPGEREKGRKTSKGNKNDRECETNRTRMNEQVSKKARKQVHIAKNITSHYYTKATTGAKKNEIRHRETVCVKDITTHKSSSFCLFSLFRINK